MLEVKISKASILKKVLNATRKLVTNVNFECTEEGISLQAMEKSHVVLVTFNLNRQLFLSYSCDRPMPLGVNLNSLTRVLKCAKDDDVCTLKVSDDRAGFLTLIYKSKNADHIAEYEMKLTDIDADQLGLPVTEYGASITMPASDFARIVRGLSHLGKSVRIEVNKEGARFASEGGAAHGSLLLKHSLGKMGKEDGEGSGAVKKEMDDEDGVSEKREKKVRTGDVSWVGLPKANGSSKPSKNEEQGVFIQSNQRVSQTFSLKYLVHLTQSSSLSHRVSLMIGNSVPLQVSYEFEHGYIRYYVAPKLPKQKTTSRNT